MASSLSYSLFFNFLFFIQLFAVRSQPLRPLSIFCLNEQGNYTVNSTYADNLNGLISSLSSLPQNNYGFYNISVGQNTDIVNSVLLCRGDVNPVDCLACIVAAGEEIKRSCPNQKEAIIWYDRCMMRYTNRTIFKSLEYEPHYTLHNSANFSGDRLGIENVLRNFLEGLRSKAAAGGKLKKFAASNASAPSFQTLYGLVQCTPDLSEQDCSDCLTWSFAHIPSCCDGTQGGRWLTPSCNFRYEIYGFFYSNTDESSTVSAPVSPPRPPPRGNDTRMSGEGKRNGDGDKAVIFVVISIVIVVLLIMAIVVFLRLRKKKPKQLDEIGEAVDKIDSVDSLLFDFGMIRDATDNFSLENKLGQGGFGTVYKGVLRNGQQIAVKRLSRDTEQGETEFKNEVLLVAKLQHRNLVKLLGFSLEGTERVLVYEFVLNTSLDKFIFDLVRCTYIDWEERQRIIRGIARGLVYLHEDSRLRIIHRDLKASNILLDEEMVPKIADFGMARLFDIDHSTQRFTSRVVGTYGYMAPEYAMHGQFSFKTDVYSFGVLVLEIVSGQRNNSFREGEDVGDLVSIAWRNWREGTALNLVDPSLTSGSRNWMLRCINIGLLCVQESVSDRPSMSSVILMLSSDSLVLPVPSQPAFSMRRSSGSELSSSTGHHSSTTSYSERSRSQALGSSASSDFISRLYPQ